MAKAINDTAGQGDPYWHEWFVGLIEIVDLLDPDKEIEWVRLQDRSVKVWDDVVVKAKSETRYYQVKHSRVNTNLTFGDLVSDGADDTGNTGKEPLLQHLFKGWRTSGIGNAAAKLILYTNRKDGTHWSRTGNGNRRPPLLEFWDWLKGELEKGSSLASTIPPTNYTSAWEEWRACFDLDDDAVAFLKILEIRTKEDELEGLEERVLDALGAYLGIPPAQVAQVFHSLVAALRSWTRGHDGVTVEDLCTALTIPPTEREYASAPPPPYPFFPSRIPVADQLEASLSKADGPPIFFLTGEAGSGKTSVVSWLFNRRMENAFEGHIDLRFFCFDPIRPEQPFVAADASRVTPEDLWFSLLSQLRMALKGRYFELKVPLRNACLTWVQAREHVLRLSDLLGQELGKRIVIAVDGIDHAARASQAQPGQVAEFFNSLPKPEEIEQKRIRLLVAGQPPEGYSSQYPTWLQKSHSMVQTRVLPGLESRDTLTLLATSRTQVLKAQWSEASRLIDNLTGGNTLAVVFAVAESERIGSLDDLAKHLEERQLASGIDHYYRSIWENALQNRTELSGSLSGAISLARKSLTPEELNRCFSDAGTTILQWREVLNALSPIIESRSDGYRVRHNDVRVFLSALFSGHDVLEQRATASDLATYYLRPDADRTVAHLQLFKLLELADRSAEMADVFDVDWVCEGAALGVDLLLLRSEGYLATRQLPARSSWTCVVSVACALQTLQRISDDADLYPGEKEPLREVPPFLLSEARVIPVADWTPEHFSRMVWDAKELLDAGQDERARGLLQRWVSGLTFSDFLTALPAAEFGRGIRVPDNHLASTFGVLGWLCNFLGVEIEVNIDIVASENQWDALLQFEAGAVESACSKPAGSLSDLFKVNEPHLVQSWELAVRTLADQGNWMLVGELLCSFQRSEDSPVFSSEATWLALKSGASDNAPDWISPLDDEYGQFGLAPLTDTALNNGQCCIAFANVCRALGWHRPGFSPEEIAASVRGFVTIPQHDDRDSSVEKLFLVAATLGRIEKTSIHHGWDVARTELPVEKMRRLLTAFLDVLYLPFEWQSPGYRLADQLMIELSEVCAGLGQPYLDALDQAVAPLVEKFYFGRGNIVLNVLKRRGEYSKLRKFVEHHIGPVGVAWDCDRAEMLDIVRDVAALADEVGMAEVAQIARTRSSWKVITYRDRKEYEFEEIQLWLSEALRLDPFLWSSSGWKIWQICRDCNKKRLDNRYESEILDAISAAALRCGPASWWQLMSTTLSDSTTDSWQIDTGQRLVEGVATAVQQEMRLEDEAALTLWSIALGFSYWLSEGDDASLRKLKTSLISQAPETSRLEQLLKIEDEIRNPRLKGEDSGHSQRMDEEYIPERKVIRTEPEYWQWLNEEINAVGESERQWGYFRRLFEVARARAFTFGNEEVVAGLEVQREMHVRWAFGAGRANLPEWKTLPARVEPFSWSDVGVELLSVLLESYSAETLTAAIQGMHALVSVQPSTIPKLFDRLKSEWKQHWLLNAAESWAILYPEQVESIREIIEEIMGAASLSSRLQAWVVLCRNSDAQDQERPEFPIPEEPRLSQQESLISTAKALLTRKSNKFGNVTLSNRHSAARRKLNYLEEIGLNVPEIEGLVAQNLMRTNEESADARMQHGPHRHGDFCCLPQDADQAVGDAILAVLSQEWCSQSDIHRLAQVLLDNEDPWICREKIRPVKSFDEWPIETEYGDDALSSSSRYERMAKVAREASMSAGWKLFAAQVTEFTFGQDLMLRTWYETDNPSMLISPAILPTCPTARPFVWWIGAPFESTRNTFVSGEFVGGNQRLPFGHFEIQPTVGWGTHLGWEQDPSQPTQWLRDGEVTARYEAFHGPLRDIFHRAKYRQPTLNRWVVTEAAFEQVEEVFGQLRLKQIQSTSAFHE